MDSHLGAAASASQPGTPSTGHANVPKVSSALPQGFAGLFQGQVSVEKIFDELDVNKDGVLEEKELWDGLKAMGVNLSDEEFKRLRDLLQEGKSSADFSVDLESFKRIVQDIPGAGLGFLPLDLTMWMKSLKLFEVFEGWFSAYLLKSTVPSIDADGLDAIRALEEDDLRDAVKTIEEDIIARLKEGVQRLRGEKEARESELLKAGGGGNDKFAMKTAGDGPVKAQFGHLHDFYQGLETRIGLPNPRVMAGMRGEHCEGEDSRGYFTTTNYALSTCPTTEWEFVVEPSDDLVYPGEVPSPGNTYIRQRKTLSHLLALPQIKAAGLNKEEVIALRLYTGPMFVKYNAVLRGFPAETVEDLKGNRYVTTLHAIVSGILKLGRIEKVPPSRLVFRGLGGMLLPECYYTEDEFGCRGGVELAFMSTTTKREIAVQYSGEGGHATIFEISVGQVDRGASLSFLSQYEGEDEVLFPPLSNLEVIGSPWMDRGCVVIPLRVNVNLKGVTIDELITRRKVLHVSMLDNLLAETKLASETQARMVSRHQTQMATRVCDKLAAASLLAEIKRRYAQHHAIDAETYNSDRHYKELIDEAVDAKAETLSLQLAVASRLNSISSHLWGHLPCPSPDTDLHELHAARAERHARRMRLEGRRGSAVRASDEEGEGGAEQLLLQQQQEGKQKQAPDIALHTAPSKQGGGGMGAGGDGGGGSGGGGAQLTRARSDEAGGRRERRQGVMGGGGGGVSGELERRRSSGTGRRRGGGRRLLPPALLDLWRKCAGVVAARIAAARLSVPATVLLPPIAALDLTGAGLGPIGAAALATGLKACSSSPHTLLLASNRLGSKGVRELMSALDENEGLRNSLQRLHLDDNHIEREAVAMLQAPLASCTALTDLSLGSNMLRGHPLGEPPLLRVLQGLERLKAIDVSHSNLDSRSAYLLSKMLADHVTLTSVNKHRLPARNAAERFSGFGREGAKLVRREKDALRVLISESVQDVCVMEGRAGAVCSNCSHAEERHYGLLRACYVPVYTRGPDQRCVHCGKAQREDEGGLTHFTEHEFCMEEGQRRALQEAKKRGLFRFQLEEDLGKGKTPLMEAVESGNLARVEGLLAARANVNGKNNVGQTALSMAAYQDKGAVACILLANKADIRVVDRAKQTLLVIAASNGREAVLRELLGAAGGPSLLLRTAADGRTALHWAVERGMEEVCKEMVAIGGRELLALADKSGRSCLELAAQQGMGRLCMDIMALGGQEVALLRPPKGRSCLHWAVEGSLEGVSKEMVEVGGAALLLMQADKGETALHAAAGRGNVKMSIFFTDWGGEELLSVRANDGTTALHWAAGRGCTQVCAKMIAVGGSELLMAQALDGRSALHWAAGSGQRETCQLLYGEGGKELVALQAADGWTALFWAAGAGLEEECRAMVEVGGKEALLLCGSDGSTCLHRAAWRKAEGVCIQMIAVGGAELVRKQTARDRRSCLHVAAEAGLMGVCKAMVDAGGKELLLMRDWEGDTVLHWAAAHADLALCEMAVAVGGQELLMMGGKDHASCLHCAAAAGAGPVCNFLASKGGRALLAMVDKHGHTPLHVARASPDRVTGGVNGALHELLDLNFQYGLDRT